MGLTVLRNRLAESLWKKRTVAGAWGYGAKQDATEPTSLALLALGACATRSLQELGGVVARLESWQKRDGSWPAFAGDDGEGCWATALAVITLAQLGRDSGRLTRALDWLLSARCREANWLWRLKLRAFDNKAQFDPAKFGWSWIPDTVSWVIPTAFALIALQQLEPRLERDRRQVDARISLGTAMLLDRACVGGGWNAGNKVVYQVPLRPHIDATAIALLAMRRYIGERQTREALEWLAAVAPSCASPYSVGWALLAAAAYRRASTSISDSAARMLDHLTALLASARAPFDACTLAVCCLAFDAMEGRNVFEVPS